MRKQTFLADPEWRTAYTTNNQNYYEILIDEMTEIPGILEDVDNLEHSMDAIERARIFQVLSVKLSCQVKIYRAWLASFKIQHPSSYHKMRVEPGSREERILSQIFSHSLRFDTLLAAQSILNYWIAIIIMTSCIDRCRRVADFYNLDSSEYSSLAGDILAFNDEERTLNSSTNWNLSSLCDILADNICQSIPYCLSEETGQLGTHGALAPLWAARFHFSRNHDDDSRRKHAWCTTQGKKMQRVALGLEDG
jgi:hypothetical protein